MTKTDTEITYGNSQWNEDQSVGERALREYKRRADLDSRELRTAVWLYDQEAES